MTTPDEPDPELWAKGGEGVEALALRRMPLLFAAACFALGEAMARNWQPAVVLLVGFVLLAGLVVAGLRWSLRAGVVALAGVWLAVGMWSAEVKPVPDTQAALRSYADGLSRTVRGRVVRVRELTPRVGTQDGQDVDSTEWHEPEVTDGAGRTEQVDLEVEEVEEVTPDESWMAPVSGGVRMLVARRGRPELRCGDVVEAPMRLKAPERYRDPGAWQYADYLLQQGVGVRANVAAAKLAVTPEDGFGGERDWQEAVGAGKFPSAAKAATTLQPLMDGLKPVPFKNGTYGTSESLTGGLKPVPLYGVYSLRCRVYAAQSWASGRMDGYVRSRANWELPRELRLDAKDAGMLDAMLFGDRAGLNKAQRLGFERTGSFHLFVVSGMHVALLAAMVFWITRRLRLREWMETAVTLGATAGYALLTGFGVPVQRALWMTAIFLVARLLSRERSVPNALGAAALAVLVWSPGALFEASFQMTFLAIVAIAGIAVPLGERSFLRYARAAAKLEDVRLDVTMPPRMAQFRVMLRVWGEALGEVLGAWANKLPGLAVRWSLWAAELALIGAVAEMVMVLPMAVYFHRATMFALPVNMLTVPVVALLAPMALATFVAGLLSPWVAIIPGAATAALLHGITGAIGRVSAVQAADLRVPGPVWWVAAIAVAAWAFCCWAVRRPGRRGGTWAWVGVATVLAVAVMVLWPERAVSIAGMTAGTMEVTAIDVGQGDSLLVVSPEGKTLLVDAGGPVGGPSEAAAVESGFDVGEEVVSPYLWSRRMRRLDAIALTHAHSDHMGGMPAVMRNFRPRELWVGVDAHTPEFKALIAEAATLGVTVRHFRAGDGFGWGGLRVTVLAPAVGYVNGGGPVNDDSLVMRLEDGKGSVMMEGDAEAPSERAMVLSGRLTPVTLLKVGHHGSMSSSTPEFLAALTPEDAVISVGKGNTFGHPRAEVIDRFAAMDTWLYRTDEFGLSTFLIGRDGGIREVR